MTEGAERTDWWARLRSRLTFANVMAAAAVFIALGGVGYAASGDGAWNGDTYSVKKTITENTPGGVTFQYVACDKGDAQIGGGYERVEPTVGTVISSAPRKAPSNAGAPLVPGQQYWTVSLRNKGGSGGDFPWYLSVRCADFPPNH